MTNGTPLTARQHAVLVAIVENYIATGEPVSSGAVSRSTALGSAASPATIRNEMASLVDAGFLDQPHTSAGRVPSASAFRLYVEQLKHNSAGGRLQGPSRTEVESRIDSSLAGVAGTQALLERSSQILAMLSSGVGVAMGVLPALDLLEHVHFSRLAERRILAVLVTRGGMVRDRMLTLEHDLSYVELETASNFLNENFRGWTLDRVRAELARRVETERNAYQTLHAAARDLWSRAVPPEGTTQQAVFIGGVSNLVGEREDRERLREMLSALETKQRLIELLNAYVDARQETVRVVFDLERTAPEMEGLVLIAAPARVAGDSLATIGVIGSKRMNYESNMNAVGYIAGLFDRVLDGGNTR